MLIIKGVNIFPSDVEALVRGDDRNSGEYRLVVDRFGHLDQLTVELERAHGSSEPMTTSQNDSAGGRRH